MDYLGVDRRNPLFDSAGTTLAVAAVCGPPGAAPTSTSTTRWFRSSASAAAEEPLRVFDHQLVDLLLCDPGSHQFR